MHQIFGQMRIEERFPDAQGSLLLEKIFKIYQIGDLTDVEWLLPSGGRAIIDRPINSRRHAVVDNTYAQSILTRGVVEGVRGEPWMLFSENQSMPLLAITWASLSRSFYFALETAPTNPFIVSSLRTGLRRVRRLHEKCPADVIEFLRDYHNQFHEGCRFSFVELLSSIPSMEEGWKAAKAKLGVTSRLGAGASLANTDVMTYEKLYWQHIRSAHEGKVTSWKQYDSAKALVHVLVRLRLWDDFLSFCQAKVNFLQTGLNHESTIISLHGIMVAITTKFEKIHDANDKELIKVALKEGCKFALPLSCGSDEIQLPWLFEKTNIQIISRIHTAMSESKVYQDAAAAKAKAERPVSAPTIAQASIGCKGRLRLALCPR